MMHVMLSVRCYCPCRAFDADNENIVIEYVTEDLSMYNQISISLAAIKYERGNLVSRDCLLFLFFSPMKMGC